MYDGGYYLLNTPLISTTTQEHTASDPDAIPDTILETLNIVQNTPWRINAWMYDVVSECWASGGGFAGLPEADNRPIPARIDDDRWDRMSIPERREYKGKIADIHNWNIKASARRSSFLRKLGVAYEFLEEERHYYPHFLDFRGRLYPSPQDLNPQGDDVAKALIMFADGKPLGKTGLYWLCIRMAGCFGHDKLSMMDRIEWVSANEQDIIRSGRDPVSCRFWEDAEEPWSFLATCHEYALADETCSDRELFSDFVSHLPIPVDGAANGIQHLSMMGLDSVGARATNCSSDDKRHDLYQEVADKVRSICQEDAIAGNADAVAWLSKGITRKTVKRAVMTTPYGVTDRGIRDQLIKDGFCVGVEGLAPQVAGYLQKVISTALSRTVISAREIMSYFQSVAFALAQRDIPFKWKTPHGLTVTQAYYLSTRREIKTLLGRHILWFADEDLGLSPHKQSMAAAPNVVHSFDASMACETIQRCHDEHGITSFAVIHDSYATHAADMNTLNKVLRDVAVTMYSVNRLAEFHAYVRNYAPDDIDLPEVPTRGDFDVEEVHQAKYFFA